MVAHDRDVRRRAAREHPVARGAAVDDEAVGRVDGAFEERVGPHFGEVVRVQDAPRHALSRGAVAVAHLLLERRGSAGPQREVAHQVVQHVLVQDQHGGRVDAALDEQAVDLAVMLGAVAEPRVTHRHPDGGSADFNFHSGREGNGHFTNP